MMPLPRIVAKTLSRRLDLWLPTYMATSAERLRARLKRRGSTTHVLFMVCDHFEPRHDATEPGQAEARVRRWGRVAPDRQRPGIGLEERSMEEPPVFFGGSTWGARLAK